ncbi:hypothetical protein [Phenylobacterium sp.]|uniref:hypothetical protein n=1 Tax=Phenylobacterium sp. TaxID=1871053 RepID=UPI003565F9FF
MASANPPPLRNEAEFEHALSEVERLLEEPHAPETVEDKWFNRLLSRIADFHDELPPARRDANLDRLQDLDGQLKAFGKRWPHPDDPDGDHHWSPMLGGDIDPSHHQS